jgi:hypothetical protein
MAKKKKVSEVPELKAQLNVLKGRSLIEESETGQKKISKAKGGALPAEKKKRKPNAWLIHLAEFRKNNKDLSAKDVMTDARKTYKK